jgi:Family of unknown function (DUF6090)
MKIILDTLKRRWAEYLLEMIVIIFGILGAFMLNSWNEKRNQEILEIQYLGRLATDLTNDTTYYNDRITSTKRSREQLTTFIREIYEIQESVEDIRNLIRYLNLGTNPLTTHNSVYLELTGSGNLSLIRKQELKGFITDYYRLNEELTSNIEEFNLMSNQFVVEVTIFASIIPKYMLMNVDDDPKMFTENEWQFFNDPSSEKFNATVALALLVRARNSEFLSHFERLKANANNVISEIKEELKERK